VSRRLKDPALRIDELPPLDVIVLSHSKDDVQGTVTSLPGRHAPGWTHRLLPPVMGTMLEFGPRSGSVERRLYVSGDTLHFDDYTVFASALGDFRVEMEKRSLAERVVYVDRGETVTI
jgi:hypothetical protein